MNESSMFAKWSRASSFGSAYGEVRVSGMAVLVASATLVLVSKTLVMGWSEVSVADAEEAGSAVKKQVAGEIGAVGEEEGNGFAKNGRTSWSEYFFTSGG